MREFLRHFSGLVLCFVSAVAAAQPVANFSANVVSGCSPIVVQFTDASTGSPTSWSWNLGNGTTSNVKNPSTTYITPGTYTVSLTAANASGSSVKTMTGYITVIAQPVVSFTGSDTAGGCAPKTVAFTSNVTAGAAGALTYFWDFGDGTTGSAANPVKTYNTLGNFTVTLLATNSAGCSNSLTKSAYIKTSSKPSGAFSASGGTVCTMPATVSFTNTTSGAVSYFWDFGNGNTSTAINPTANYTAAGNYIVKLVSTGAGGCKDTVQQTVSISTATLSAGFTAPATGCTGAGIAFSNTSNPAPGSVLWSFGDGTTSTVLSPTKVYTSAGTYSVKLKVLSGSCADSVTKTIAVSASPVAGISASPTSNCTVPTTVAFTNGSTGAASYTWNFGDGTSATAAAPSKTYSSYGNYAVTLTATAANGCVATASSTVSLAPPVLSVAPALPNGSCIPAVANFTTAMSPAPAGTTYSWTFGDGSNGTGASPAHTYTTTGSYTVTVTATTPGGCTATATATVAVGAKPVAAFTGSPLAGCVGQNVTFANTSTGATSYLWNYGTSATTNTVSPTITYSDPATYTITLIATNNGCSDTMVKPAYVVITGPEASFTDAFSCSSKLAHSFSNSSTGATSYSWNFGDGTTSSSASPSHTYSGYGTYIVSLNASNGTCVSTYARTLRLVNPSVQFSGTPLGICKGGTVTFTPQSTAGIQAASWSFGDGTGAGPSNPGPVSKTYTAAGVYAVKFFIADSTGCNDSLVKNAYVTVGGPTAAFSANPLVGCVPAAVTFADASTTSGVAITARTWSFGNGTTATGNNTAPATTYGVVGSYGVKLVVTDANGCKDSITTPNYISVVKPTASFSTPDTFRCPGQAVNFINSSASAATYLWDFGDGTTSTAASPVKTYAAAGSYTVRLVVTSVGGCKDTSVRTSYVKIAGGFAQFTMSDSVATCPPLSVQFANTSVQGASYVWSFGNGTGSVLTSPSTLFSVPGVFTVKLRTTNIIGCVDSTTRTVTVGGPTGTLSYTTPVAGCVPLTIGITVNAVNTVSYTYDFNNGITQSGTGNTAAYTYPAGGFFVPKVVLSNGTGCNVALISPDTIKVNKVTAAFSASVTSICQGGAVQFTDASVALTAPVSSRFWDFGDGTTSTATAPLKVYTTAGVFTVKLRAGSGLCTDSMTKTITVLAKPQQVVAGGSAICTGTSTNLVASGASTYSWSPAAGLSCTTCANPTAGPAATTTYTVIGTAANGCSDTSQVTVSINPLPVITTSANAVICAGTSTTLTAGGAVSYVWSPAAGLSCTTCASPAAAPAASTTYTVTGTDANGCNGTKPVAVTVNPAPTLTVSPAVTICAGTSASLTASGASTYSWSPATGLSCTTCANPAATPAATTTYTVTGTAAGCSSTASVTVNVTPLPVLSATAAPAGVCLGSSTTLTATGAGTYSWAASPTLNCTACAAPVATPAATTTYTVTGTGAGGCTATANVTVAVSPIPTVTAATSQNNICAGTTTILTAGGAATYSWSPAAGLSCNPCASPAATPQATTTYTVTGTSAAGCSGTATVTVTVRPLPVLSVSPAVAICIGKSAPLTASGATAYSWTPAADLSCTTCANPTAAPTATTTYTVTGTGANGCSANKAVTVTVNPLPNVSAGSDRVICASKPGALQATGAASYVWSPATGLSCTACANPTATLTVPVTYTVTGTDANGCVDSAHVRLTIMPKNAVSVSPPDTICLGSSASLTAVGGDRYTWFPAGGLNNTNAASPGASPASTTTYAVVINQGACYSDTLHTTVVVTPIPTVNAGPDQTVFGGNKVQLNAQVTAATKYSWSPAEDLSCSDCLAPEATPKRTTTYRLEAITSAGCSASDEIIVAVRCDNQQVFVPNTFTPNGDGHNDRFYPRGKGLGTVLRFRIYNRWGETVFDRQSFQANDDAYGWDGTFQGGPLKPDVYVWMLEAQCESGEPLTLKGDISLVR